MKIISPGSLKAGLNTVRNTKIRSFWTMLGVIIGVSSFISVVAIGNGIKEQIDSQIHHLGQNIITVRPAQLHPGSGSSASNSSLISGLSLSGPLSSRDVNEISKVQGVADSAPLTIASGKVVGDNGTYNDGYVIGTTGAFPSLINQSIAFGSFFDDSDDGANIAIIGQHAADAMYNVDVPLGRSFTFRGERFIIWGIFNQFSATPLSQQADFNNAIFVPNQVIEDLSNKTAPTYEMLVRPNSAKDIPQVSERIRQSLDRLHGGPSGFTVSASNQNLSANNNILDLLTKMIAGVAAISLLVGGLGIMNVMLVSVSERMHEIGIRKAIGATNRQILNQFLIESSMLSLIGGIIGIGVAFVIELLLRLFTSLQPSISWQVVVLATGVSLLTGIVFGTAPAVKAAHKDPIEALRSE